MENQTEMPENTLEGKVRYHATSFLCCSKLIDLYVLVDKEVFHLYYDKEKKKEFIKIQINDIIAINKRQIDRYDVHKFSVYYKKPGRQFNECCEIKLKAGSRRETDQWIENLNRKLKPPTYKFTLQKNKIALDSYLTGYDKEPKKFFKTLSHLEYIIRRKSKIDAFNTLKRRSGIPYLIRGDENSKTLEEESLEEDSNMMNNSELFGINLENDSPLRNQRDKDKEDETIIEGHSTNKVKSVNQEQNEIQIKK